MGKWTPTQFCERSHLRPGQETEGADSERGTACQLSTGV